MACSNVFENEGTLRAPSIGVEVGQVVPNPSLLNFGPSEETFKGYFASICREAGHNLLADCVFGFQNVSFACRTRAKTAPASAPFKPTLSCTSVICPRKNGLVASSSDNDDGTVG